MGLSKYLWLKKSISARDLLPWRKANTPLQKEPAWQEYLNPTKIFVQGKKLLLLASGFSQYDNFIRVNDCLCWDATHCYITRNDPTCTPGLKRILPSGIMSPYMPLSLKSVCPDPETFKKLLNILFDLFTGQRFEKLKKRGKKLKRALLFFESASKENGPIRDVLHTIALEAILANEESEIAEKFSIRLALLLGNNEEKRIALKEFGKKLYKARSRYVHGSYESDEFNGALDFLSDKRLPSLEKLVRRALLAATAGEQFVEELKKSDNKQQKTCDGLLSLLDRTLFDVTLHREYWEYIHAFWVPFWEIVGNIEV